MRLPGHGLSMKEFLTALRDEWSRDQITNVAGALTFFGVLAIFRTPVDIFPVVDIPVVSVIWTFNGMGPEEMTNRITTNTERAFTTTVNVVSPPGSNLL